MLQLVKDGIWQKLGGMQPPPHAPRFLRSQSLVDFCIKHVFKSFNAIVRIICDTLCDLIPFVQFKKREKHTLRGMLHLVKLQASASAK